MPTANNPLVAVRRAARLVLVVDVANLVALAAHHNLQYGGAQCRQKKTRNFAHKYFGENPNFVDKRRDDAANFERRARRQRDRANTMRRIAVDGTNEERQRSRLLGENFYQLAARHFRAENRVELGGAPPLERCERHTHCVRLAAALTRRCFVERDELRLDGGAHFRIAAAEMTLSMRANCAQRLVEFVMFWRNLLQLNNGCLQTSFIARNRN